MSKRNRNWWENPESRKKCVRVNSITPVVGDIQQKQESVPEGATIVHGYMIYECKRCGTVYQMYLEKGLEDRVQDLQYPYKHKPVPFAIGCRECAKVAVSLGRKEYYGTCYHILWGIGDSDEYEELPEGASYFKNDPKADCGVAICRKSYRNRDAWSRDMEANRLKELDVEWLKKKLTSF